MSTEIKNEQLEQLTKQFKEMEVGDLFKALKVGLAEAEKRSKTKAKAKTGSMPKGACPPQLKLNNAWVKHVKDYVNLNGWEAFSVPTTTTDKETGAKTLVVEELPASILHDDAYIFEGSVTEETPQGVQVSHKHAMTLSKQWKEGANAHLYEAFVSAFNPEEEESDADSVASTESVTVVRTTMAEKIAAKAEKEAKAKAEKAEKEAEKAAAKLAKEAEKAVKEATAAELKAKKAIEAEAAKAEKVRAAAEAAAEAEALKAAKVPKAAIVKATPVKEAKAKVETAIVKAETAIVKAETAIVKAEKPAKAETAIVKAEKPAKAETAKPAAKATAIVKKIVKADAKPAVKAWSCEDDGNAHSWEHQGTHYARNFTNDVWNRNADGEVTTWAGAYLPAEDRIDETAAEPLYED